MCEGLLSIALYVCTIFCSNQDSDVSEERRLESWSLRKWRPVCHRFWYLLILILVSVSVHAWFKSYGLLWVQTRHCFVSDVLQTSVMPGKETGCSVLFLGLWWLLQSFSVLNWQTCPPLQQGEGLRVTESPMLQKGWENKHWHLEVSNVRHVSNQAPEIRNKSCQHEDRKNHWFSPSQLLSHPV